MLGQQQASLRTGAVLFALLMLFADISGGVLANTTSTSEVSEYEPPILVEGLPPLMCGEELCERPTRLFERGDRASSEPDQWWQAYGPDLDWNGMDDRLQRVLAGQESVSPTAIMGPDGRKTVAIVVDYAWAPNGAEIAALADVLGAHGWLGEEAGAWFQVMSSIDSVVVDKVPVSALLDIYHLPGVVVIEMQNVMIPFNGVASEAARAMPSDVYSASTYARGYTGEGVVIAVLDTGVDNEHRARTTLMTLTMNPTVTPRVIATRNGSQALMQHLLHPTQTARLTPMTAKATAPMSQQQHLVRVEPTELIPEAAWGLILSTSKFSRTPEVPIHRPRSTGFSG